MGPRGRLITIVGLGLLVAVSTLLQTLLANTGGTLWRPYVLLGAGLAGAIAAWQLIASVLLVREAGAPKPIDPAPRKRSGRLRRPWTLAIVASVVLLVAVASVLLQLRPPPPAGNPPPPTMVWKASGDTTLYWSTLDGTGWSPGHAFADRESSTGAALAFDTNLVHMAWREPDDSHIFWSTFDGTGWSTPRRLDDRRTDTVPALAVSDDGPVMTWKGVDGDTSIYWSRFNGAAWSLQAGVDGAHTHVSPSLASASGVVHMAWLEPIGDHLQFAVLQASTWTTKRPIGNRWNSNGPALGCAPGGTVFLVWKGGGDDERIWWSTLAGSTWTGQEGFDPPRATAGIPRLSCAHGSMLMVWAHTDGTGVYWARFDGVNWTYPRHLDDRQTDAMPAIA